MQTALKNTGSPVAPPPVAPAAVQPPVDPIVAQEWLNNLLWWEKKSDGLATITPSLTALQRAQQLLEGILLKWTPGNFWREIRPEDRHAALLAAMAQHRTYNPISKSLEPNQKVLPPFDLCLQMLEEHAGENRVLVYLILREGNYLINEEMQKNLGTHFERVMKEPDLSPLARLTAERLGFRRL